MNITEEDVRSELDFYGLGDSRISIGKESVTVQGKKHWYQFFASHVLYKLTSGIGVPSMVIEKHIESTEIFPKEHRQMCRSIVRLITGEKQTEKIEIVEASVEDKMLAILAAHDIEQSDEEIEKTRISEEGFARIYAAGFLSIVIQPEEEVMHISTLTSNPKTHSHGLPVWENMDSDDFPHGSIGYVWWLDHLKPALFEIIDILESPASTPERTEAGLHDTVSEILESVPDAELLGVHYGKSGFVVRIRRNGPRLDYWIDSDAVEFGPVNHPRGGKETSRNTHEQYYSKGNLNGEEWGEAVKRIIAEIKKRQSTPEKSLEEKVRVLIESERTFIGDKITVEPHQVLIQVGDRTITITKDSVHDSTDDETDRIAGLTGSGWDRTVQELFRNIAAELKKHQPSPTYTELEQRVRELEKDSDIWKGLAYTEETRAGRAEEKYELAKRELSELRESHIQQGSVEGHKIEKLQGRITELEAQLQDYVSPADHEREMRNNEELLAIITKQRDDCNAQAKQYLSWFHSEYAKNAGVSR